MNNEEHNPWKILSQAEQYDNAWIKLTEFQVLNPNGGRGIYGKIHFKNIGIGIIPIDADGYTWLVGQYRFPLDQYSWEIPEGGGNLNAPPIELARRELLEETGLRAENWTEIQRMHLSNSVSDELAIIYVATGLSQGEAEPEETEQLQLKKVHINEAYQLVINGTITDSMSVAGILKLKLLMLENQLPDFTQR